MLMQSTSLFILFVVLLSVLLPNEFKLTICREKMFHELKDTFCLMPSLLLIAVYFLGMVVYKSATFPPESRLLTTSCQLSLILNVSLFSIECVLPI